MFGFKKKDPEVSKEVQSAIVELEAAKNAQREAFAEAEKVGKDLNRLLVENGFTLKIYLASGGKIKKDTLND